MRRAWYRVIGHEGLPHEHDVGARRAVVRDIGGDEDGGFGDLHGVGGDPLDEAAEQVAVEVEGRQVAGVHADEPRAEVRGAIDLVGGVGLDQRGHPPLERERVQARQQVLLECRDDEQDEVGARSAGFEHLVLGRDEVLAQHRQAHGGLDGDEVGEAALEPAALGEDRDRAGAALLVEPGLVCGIGDGGEVAARGARALHLGDDLDAVAGRQCGEGVDRRRAARVRLPRPPRAAARRLAPQRPAPRRP